jgi:hypothetical protein
MSNEAMNAAERPGEPARFDPEALTRALRIAGAILVVASASTFMLQRWNSGDDLFRYAMLVGQSLLLAAAAYFVGLTLREGRSARTFLGLVLLTMPVSFAVLGGLVYSRFHVEPLEALPHYASWIASSDVSAVIAVVATLVVLVPLGVLSFVALARKEARALSAAFFAANLLILIPVRQPLAVAAVAGITLIGLLHVELFRFAGKAWLDTLEGKVARAMPFLPPIIMLGRAFHLYAPGAAFAGELLLIAAAALWLSLPRVTNLTARDAGAWLSIVCSVTGWGLCALEFPHSGSDAMRLLAVGLPGAVLMGIGATRAAASRRVAFGFATAVGLVTGVLACALEPSTVTAFVSIVSGVAVAVWGAAERSGRRMVAGGLVALAGTGVEIWLAVHHDDVLRWLSLSAVGVLLIVGSAYVERNRSRITRFWERGAARRVATVDEAQPYFPVTPMTVQPPSTTGVVT